MSHYSTRWTFEVNGHRFEGTRTIFPDHRPSKTNVTLYVIDDGAGGGLAFSDSHLAPLRAFLTAMDNAPGAPVLRCEFCDADLHYEVSVGRWLNKRNEPACSEHPHEPKRLAAEY